MPSLAVVLAWARLMRRRLTLIQTRVLPHGWADVVRQVSLFVLAYGLYEVVRGLVATQGTTRPYADATRIIDLERLVHVFVEPSVQAWAARSTWIMDGADWIYLNAHLLVTLGALMFVYLRRNDSFYFVRNMFLIAMAIALVGYAVYPTAPPRLLPGWGFTDSIAQFLGVAHLDEGPGHGLLNFYAAVPSMHVGFAAMVGGSMSRLVRPRAARMAWCAYPVLIAFIVVATGNHFLIDVVLGFLTAGVSALAATQLLARARPNAWAFSGAVA
jgi:membrane-associated phospholipid phosphatase